jgi:hypothetical protein
MNKIFILVITTHARFYINVYCKKLNLIMGYCDEFVISEFLCVKGLEGEE